MKKLIIIVGLIAILSFVCSPKLYFIGSEKEFISLGYKKEQIIKVEKIDKGNRIYNKIYYK